MNIFPIKKSIKCGIIGCGDIAGNFDRPNLKKIRTHAKAFINNKNCDLCSVCDLDLTKAKKFSKTWNVKNFSNNIHEFLENELDIISICTPTDTHAAIFEKISLHTPKVVWLEKPSSSKCKDIENMINLSKGKFEVWVNYFRKYTTGYLEIKNEISSIGKIQYVNCYYTKGFQHNGSHLIDLIIFLFGPIVNFKVIDYFRRDGFIDVDIKLVTNNAEIFVKSLDFKHFELFELDLIGSNGRILIKERGSNIQFLNVRKSNEFKGYKILKNKKIIKNTLNYSMRDNLSFGLLGKRKKELESDLIVQNFISNVINNIGKKNENI